ncbi:uncharacterized protein [Rutidosis leptorrhynchoides]|uniref:uncharacterized protein n=1 Tax=Rutidosis leptorrhynchoides TaxID=125765 RepID=UPI003A99DE76
MSSWVSFFVLLLCFSFNGFSNAARHPKQSAVIVGTVYCDTCFSHQVSNSPHHFISGATVAVECSGKGQTSSFQQEVKTNNNGEFKVKIPFTISKNVDTINHCSVKQIRSSEPYCAVAATATSSNIHFISKKAGTHIYSAGFFTFKPELCSQKDLTGKDFPPSLRNPPAPFLPPIGEGLLPPLPVPDMPIPPLVPPLPGVPLLPPVNNQKPPLKSNNNDNNEVLDKKIFGFPPNPFQPPSIFPPPSILPPLPFQPSPPSLIPPLIPSPSPPALIPPLVPSPPPAGLFPPLPGFPPVPGLFPSPPPPPPPTFPIPLPPLPLIPGFPPVPPASGKNTP